jgi:hypothetical protein
MGLVTPDIRPVVFGFAIVWGCLLLILKKFALETDFTKPL